MHYITEDNPKTALIPFESENLIFNKVWCLIKRTAHSKPVTGYTHEGLTVFISGC